MIELPRVVLGNNTYSIVYYERDEDTKISPYNAPYPTDPELGMDNLCEAKHHMLTRSARAEIFERELKPNASTRETLEKILQVNLKRFISYILLFFFRLLLWKA